MIYKKFEFTPTKWATLKKLIQQTTTNPDGEKVTSWNDCAVVEIGNIVITPAVMEEMEVITPAVLSKKWAVDILFYGEVPAEFEAFEVYPEGGVHTFQGCESMYMDSFYAKFPDKKPQPTM
jgi:hypothetical protein